VGAESEVATCDNGKWWSKWERIRKWQSKWVQNLKWPLEGSQQPLENLKES
jgi:hypothetical protein